MQFYAARVLRSSVIEDLGCHWYKRTLPLLPIPPNLSVERIEALRVTGQAVLDADSDIANLYREIDALIAKGNQQDHTVNRLKVGGDPLVAGINLNGVSEKPVPVLHVQEVGDEIRTSDLFFRLVVPNADLRTFVAFQLARHVEDKPDAELAREDVLAVVVPTNLDDVVAAIRSLTSDDLEARYMNARDALDRLVAEQCGISNGHRDHMVSAMISDPILSKMRPMLAQRGLRVQPYADHSEGGRYE